ncbi:B-cell receptor-associated protein 31-like-domain-containing protein [Pilaira anomala]|nr:B-cell receptor-associated protein 31-like-domain-containing protein [Pilaira anomala]
MTIYYTAVFVILVIEMVAFGILVVLQAISILKFVFGFIFLLFIDAVNRLQRLDQENTEEKSQFHDYGYEASQKANKFYAQRNLYLTGFTLFLSLILERTSTLIITMLKHDEALEYAREEHKSSSKDQERLIEMENNFKAQIDALNKEVDQLRTETEGFESLKQKTVQEAEEYHKLSIQQNLLPTEKK